MAGQMYWLLLVLMGASVCLPATLSLPLFGYSLQHRVQLEAAVKRGGACEHRSTAILLSMLC